MHHALPVKVLQNSMQHMNSSYLSAICHSVKIGSLAVLSGRNPASASDNISLFLLWILSNISKKTLQLWAGTAS